MGTKLTVKVLPAHRAALDAMAEQEQEPVSVLLRRLIRTEAERRGVWPDPAPMRSTQRAETVA